MQRALDAVEYSVDTDGSNSVKLGLVVAGQGGLGPEQRDYINKLFVNTTKWVPL